MHLWEEKRKEGTVNIYKRRKGRKDLHIGEEKRSKTWFAYMSGEKEGRKGLHIEEEKRKEEKVCIYERKKGGEGLHTGEEKRKEEKVCL